MITIRHTATGNLPTPLVASHFFRSFCLSVCLSVFLQFIGIFFLWYIDYDVKNTSWWLLAATAYYALVASPVALQSMANFGITCYRLRQLVHLKRLTGRSVRHLLFKELFRMVIVGGGSTFVIAVMPTLIWHKGYYISAMTSMIPTWGPNWGPNSAAATLLGSPRLLATLVALSAFITINSGYSISAALVHRLVLAIVRGTVRAAATTIQTVQNVQKEPDEFFELRRRSRRRRSPKKKEGKEGEAREEEEEGAGAGPRAEGAQAGKGAGRGGARSSQPNRNRGRSRRKGN
jgi:hypothetical protein